MPVDFGAGRHVAGRQPVGQKSGGLLGGSLGGLGGLRVGAALALVLAAANLPSAYAQSAPDPSAPDQSAPADLKADDTVAADEPQGQTGPARTRDAENNVVFVYGRKVSTSIAAMPDNPAQVVNVISAETLAEQGVTSLEQALRNVPGITTQIGEGGTMNGDQFFIRGLSAKDDIYTDGLRDFGVFTRDAFNYGQVEVLKGPSSTTLGRGTTGGGINTTSKVPYLQTGGNASAATGSASYARATGDWNRVIGDGIAVRVNAMVHSQEIEGRDMIKSDRWGIAPSIGFGLGGDTSFTLAYLHQEDDRVPDYGIPSVNVGGVIGPAPDRGVPRNLFYGYNSDRDESLVDTVTARLRHVVNDELTLTSDTKYGVYVRYFQQTVPNVCADATGAATGVTRCATYLTDNDPLTIPQVSIGGPGPYDQTTTGVQNVSTAAWNAIIGGFRSELLAGWDVSWQNNDRDQFNYSVTRAPKDILNPAHDPSPPLSPVRNNVRDSTAKDMSIFVNERFWLNDQWSISAGLRAERYEIDQNTTTFTVTPPTTVTSVYAPLSANSDLVSPRVSVIWEPAAGQSYYVAYATSATPPGITVANGSAVGSQAASDLDPEKNTSYEAGARFALRQNKIQVQASVFRIKKNNAKLIDPATGLYQANSGDSQEVQGFELGLAGAITEQWSFNASYAFTDTETTDSAPVAPGATCAPVAPATNCPSPNLGMRVPFAPEHAASLWSTYTFVGPLAGLEAGIGVTYQGDVALNPANTGFAPDYTSVDALVSYGWDRYRFSLNAYNLTDELYYTQVQNNRLLPVAERNFIATLGVVF